MDSRRMEARWIYVFFELGQINRTTKHKHRRETAGSEKSQSIPVSEFSAAQQRFLWVTQAPSGHRINLHLPTCHIISR